MLKLPSGCAAADMTKAKIKSVTDKQVLFRIRSNFAKTTGVFTFRQIEAVKLSIAFAPSARLDSVVLAIERRYKMNGGLNV